MSPLDDGPGFLVESSGWGSSKFERDWTSVDFFGLDVGFVLSGVVVLGVGVVVEGVVGVVTDVDVGVVVGDVASVVVVGVVVGSVDGVVVGDVGGVVDDGVVDDGVVVGSVDEEVVVVS